MVEKENTEITQREDLYNSKSDKQGFGGAFESFIRKFRSVSFMIALGLLYFLILLPISLPQVTLGMYLRYRPMDRTCQQEHHLPACFRTSVQAC